MASELEYKSKSENYFHNDGETIDSSIYKDAILRNINSIDVNKSTKDSVSEENDNKSASKKRENNGHKHEAVKEEKAKGNTKNDEIQDNSQEEEKKEVTLSRGILQFISEGDFSGGDGDARYPTFPQNIYIFLSHTDLEKTAKIKENNDNKKKNSNLKDIEWFEGPDDIGRFKLNANGKYTKEELQKRLDKNTYTKTLETGKVLGTIGGQSGVTIGFGIDIGNKWKATESEAARSFFKSGDVNELMSAKLAECVGLKGVKAAEKAANIRSEVLLTEDMTLKLHGKTIVDYDNIGYTRGDGKIHSVLEELLMACSYWGTTSIKNSILTSVKGKEVDSQISIVYELINNKITELEERKRKLGKDASEVWMLHGLEIFLNYLEIIREMDESGIEVKIADSVQSKADFTSENNQSAKFIQDLTERKSNYASRGKDYSKMLGGTDIPYLIKDVVGENGKNNSDDVKVVQQLLFNGNYDVEVNGIYDEKTIKAIGHFMSKEIGKEYKTFDPGGKSIRVLKRYQYINRTTEN